MTPKTVTYRLCNTPTAAQRRRLIDLLQQMRARRTACALAAAAA